MECAQNSWLSNEAYLQQFRQKTVQQRVPVSGSLELTHRCNLRCVHCYLGHSQNGKNELTTEQWFAILDEITEAGCLYLLLTGGEPLLRSDFAEIYTRARTNGMLVTVFTNGTLIADHILDVLQECPPLMVEISLYGATAATYERITGISGSYHHCLEGIQRLLEHHIPLRLKTMLMTYNRHELYEMENMAKHYGVKFRFDPAIFPCFTGDKFPLQLRVSPAEAIEKEFSDADRVQRWAQYVNRRQGMVVSDTLYHCSTGLTSFHINPYGRLQPCLMVTNLQYDLLNGNFQEGWRQVIARIRDKKASQTYRCNHCEKLVVCECCPAFFELENGAEENWSEYLCTLGHYRYNRIQQYMMAGGSHAI